VSALPGADARSASTRHSPENAPGAPPVSRAFAGDGVGAPRAEREGWARPGIDGDPAAAKPCAF